MAEDKVEETAAADATKTEEPKLSDLSGHKKEELLASLAILVLADGEKDISVDNINALLEKSGNTKSDLFAGAFATLAKGREVMDMINLGGGGGGGGAGPAAGGDAAAEEEKKEEEEEEEEEEVALGGALGGGDDDGW